jgi:hypothetical protein
MTVFSNAAMENATLKFGKYFAAHWIAHIFRGKGFLLRGSCNPFWLCGTHYFFPIEFIALFSLFKAF